MQLVLGKLAPAIDPTEGAAGVFRRLRSYDPCTRQSGFIEAHGVARNSFRFGQPGMRARGRVPCVYRSVLDPTGRPPATEFQRLPASARAPEILSTVSLCWNK